MNGTDARGRLTDEGWIGEFKFCRQGQYTIIQETGRDGKFIGPRIFANEQEAEVTAWRCLRDIQEPVMVRSGPMINAARAKADAVFRRERV